MNGKINTPRTVCKAIVAVAIAAIAVAAIIGCSSLGGGSRRQSIATVIQTAYGMGGREPVAISTLYYGISILTLKNL